MQSGWCLPFFAAAALALAGCAAPDPDAAVRGARRMAVPQTEGAEAVVLQRDAQARMQAEAQVQAWLAQPLSMEAAVQVALAQNPELQAALSSGWGALADAQAGSLPGGLRFGFERLRDGPGLEIGRLLSLDLLDLITLPQRRAVAGLASEAAAVRMAAAIVDQVHATRQGWIRAVAAQEAEAYSGRVMEAAEAAAEMAQRMRRSGNFSSLQAARQHLFYADATARLAAARHASLAAREELVRVLGLSDAQAALLRLPERMPELPAQPRSADSVAQAAAAQRLDLRLAFLALQAAGGARQADLLEGLVEVELGLRRDSVFDGAGGRSSPRGVALDIRLPLFDAGAARGAVQDARILEAANRYEAARRAATSQTRERYAAYRTAWDLARHQRDELLPLRRRISEENLLRYNGMLIGVFELLADAREQAEGVIAALDAQRDFWLADAALASTLIGQPPPAGSVGPRSPAPLPSGAGH